MATIWRGVAGFSNRSASHLVVRLRSQTGEYFSVMQPRASPCIANSCNMRVSRLSQAPVGKTEKVCVKSCDKCFWPGIVACVQGPGGLEPEEPGDDLPEIVESSPEKQLLDEMALKKAANGAANNETSSEEDFTSSESDSRLKTDEDTKRKQLLVGLPVGLPILTVFLKTFKSQVAIVNYLKANLVSNFEQVILTVIVTLVWIKAFYDLGLTQGDFFHVFCPDDNHHRYCVVFLEFVHKYFR